MSTMLVVLLLVGVVFADPLIDNVDHIIIVYEENWSYDAMFGNFPGANGHISNKSAVLHPQTNKTGYPYETLPPIYEIPAGLPNKPFSMDQYINDSLLGYPDPTHRFYEEQYMINGGLMDRYIAWNKAGSIAYGYWDSNEDYIAELARNYTLFDNFYHSAFGPSLLNHFWMACACTPKWESSTPPPTDMIAVLDSNGFYTNAVAPTISPDLYLIGTLSPAIPPIDPAFSPAQLAPPLHNDTIGDVLSEAGVSWVYYQDGYGNANAGNPPPKFEYNHNPFLFFAKYANGTQARAEHMKDSTDFFASLKSNTLPQVSWIKPSNPKNFHPRDSDRTSSQEYLKKIIDDVKESKYWNRTLVIVTFDEHGGFFDHVPPPVVDRWGPGSRVPAIMVSPYAKKGFVDSTELETISIHQLLKRRFSLPRLVGVRAAKNDMTSSLQFPNPTSKPTASPTTTGAPIDSSSNKLSFTVCALLVAIFLL